MKTAAPIPRPVPVHRPLRILLLAAVLGGIFSDSTPAAEPVQDHRHGPLKDLNGFFPFAVPSSKEAWEQRSEQLRKQVQVALGLFPFPSKTPLRPVRHGRRDLDGYAVEKVFFEAMPGFFVTGNLYLPLGLDGPFPAVLSPHGHWNDGRFMQSSDAETAREIASGGETDEAAARSPLQARCVQLARMGCVVFHYDMIGYADSIQLPLSLAHQFRAQRPEMVGGAEGWGFFSAAAESRLQSIMGLQTWSSIRAMDFLTELPEVDPARIGVTGASGGATQTFLLAAIDPRPAAIFPAVMVSTGMQGGCTCENASLLRIGTGNVELAALFAPKPAAYTTADDWTKDFARNGYPQLQTIYQLTGAPQNVSLHDRTEFPHNFNLPSRLAMYKWFAQHLKTPRPAPAEEAPFTRLTKNDLTVWDESHPPPAAADPGFERALLRNWHEDSQRQIDARPELIDEALPVLAGRTWKESQEGPFDWKPDESRSREGAVQRIGGVLTHGKLQEKIRCLFYYPDQWSGHVTVRLTSNDHAQEATEEWARTALAAGTALAFPTLFTEPASSPAHFRRVEKDRDFVGYTAGYNHLPLARRAQDLMGLLAFMQQHDPKPATLHVDAAEDCVPEAALALSQVPPSAVSRFTAAKTGFGFAGITNPFDPRLLPGAAKYGDLPALLRRATRSTP